MPSLTLGDIFCYGLSLWLGWVLAYVIINYFAPKPGQIKKSVDEGCQIFIGAVLALMHFNYHG